MGRGKAFNHKKKGHASQPPEGSILEREADEHHLEDLPDVLTLETYKNSLRKGKK